MNPLRRVIKKIRYGIHSGMGRSYGILSRYHRKAAKKDLGEGVYHRGEKGKVHYANARENARASHHYTENALWHWTHAARLAQELDMTGERIYETNRRRRTLTYRRDKLDRHLKSRKWLEEGSEPTAK